MNRVVGERVAFTWSSMLYGTISAIDEDLTGRRICTLTSIRTPSGDYVKTGSVEREEWQLMTIVE